MPIRARDLLSHPLTATIAGTSKATASGITVSHPLTATIAGTSAVTALLGKQILNERDEFDLYRGQAYALITPEHIDHVITRLGWAAFITAQRPSLTETEEAADDPRRAPVIAERAQVAGALDKRLNERDVRERAAIELLAWAWASWGTSWEGATIADMLEWFIPDDESWEAFSETTLELDYLRKILEAHGPLPAMAPAFRNNWGTIPSIALVRGALRHLITPWEGDRRYWPEARFDWAGSSPGHVMFTLHESPTGGTPAQIQAAWDHVDSINEWVGVTLATVAAIYQHNKRHGGRLIVETNDFLKAWGKGTAKGFKATDKDRVNAALFTLSQIVVQRLEYTYRPIGKRSKVSESVRTEHLLFLDRLGNNGRNIKWDIYLGAPLLQMMGHFPLQIADITEGSIGPDGNDPYRARFDLLIPIEARARPAVFTQHGMPVRELLELLDIAPADIDPRKRTYWRKYLPELLNNSRCLEMWQFAETPGTKWEQWLEARVLLHVRRKPHDRGNKLPPQPCEVTPPAV